MARFIRHHLSLVLVRVLLILELLQKLVLAHLVRIARIVTDYGRLVELKGRLLRLVEWLAVMSLVVLRLRSLSATERIVKAHNGVVVIALSASASHGLPHLLRPPEIIVCCCLRSLLFMDWKFAHNLGAPHVILNLLSLVLGGGEAY